MTTRSTTARRKRPALTSAVPQQATVMPDSETVENSTAEDDLRQQAVQEFEASLRSQDGVDEEGVTFLLDAFRSAVQEVSLDSALSPPDPDELIRTLNRLAESGLIDEEDRNALSRQFEVALEPLEDKRVQVALEYAQRLERDGEEKALQWLNAQRSEQEAQEQGTPSNESPRLRQSITQSRSRRLRGPPST